MPATSKKLTVREVQDRVNTIRGRRVFCGGEPQWADPEDTQRLIDQLREDVIQAIAEGHRAPLALTRCIAELPRVHYATIPVEPARMNVVNTIRDIASRLGKIDEGEVFSDSEWSAIFELGLDIESEYETMKSALRGISKCMNLLRK